MDYKDYLDTTVLQEKNPVTYRSLARNLNIHVNTAKQALYYYSTVESSVIAIFCLSGTLADHSFSIRLVSQDDLEETKKLYRQVSGIHVYGILPYRPKDFSVLVTANKDMVAVSVEDRIKNGLIFNSSVKMNNIGKTSIPAPSTSAPPPSKEPTTSTPSVTKNTTEKKSIFGSMSTSKPAATTSTKSKTTSSNTTPAKRKGTLSFDKATPRAAKKQEIEKPKSPPPTTPHRKIRTIQESDDGEEDEEALDERLARSATIQVNDIFSDDDENDEPTSSKDQDNSTPTMDIDVDADNDDENKSDNGSSKMDQDENSDQEKETAPGKVRRKVQKKKTYKNERGFLVTEDVWEWEEVDADTPTTKPSKPKTPAPSSPVTATAKKSSTTPKKAPGEQKSLLSFWGKR